MSGHSAGSIVELSRRKSCYHDQDQLLKAFVDCSGYTAKEVAVEALDWRYEQYSNAPKRAFDLQRLGYLEQLDGKVCRQTGKLAHTYRTTDKGVEHLRKQGISIAPLPFVPENLSVPDPVGSVCASEGKKRLSEIRELLWGGNGKS